MSLRTRLLVTIALAPLLISFVACGGDPPDKEIQQADAAIAAAKTAGADRYAADEFKAAQEALTHAREAVDERDYRLALNHALDSRERAQNAAAQAAAGLVAARTEADHAISDAVSDLDAASSKVKAATAVHVSPRVLAGHQAGIADAEARLQEARTAWEQGDFAAATTAATTASEHLHAVMDDFDVSPVAPVRRRR
jgi:hypothetical protein